MDYEYMQPLWEISASAMPQTPTMDQVAAATGGRLIVLAGSNAVERPNDSMWSPSGPKSWRYVAGESGKMSPVGSASPR